MNPPLSTLLRSTIERRQSGIGVPSGTRKNGALWMRMIAAAAIACCFASAAQAQLAERAVNSLKDHPDWVRVPGAWARPDCVHEVPNGARVEENGNITLAGAVIAHYDACPEKPISTLDRPRDGQKAAEGTPCGMGCNWVEQVWEPLGLAPNANLDVIESYWTVPQPPSETGALVFLWNGVEPINAAWVMQTVLQWGYSNASGQGGNYWIVTCWLVGNTGFYYSGSFKADPGDVIIGATFELNSKLSLVETGWDRWAFEYDDDYEISGYDVNKGIGVEFGEALTGVLWNSAYAGVLEVDNLTSCAQLPPGPNTQFYNNFVTTNLKLPRDFIG